MLFIRKYLSFYLEYAVVSYCYDFELLRNVKKSTFPTGFHQLDHCYGRRYLTKESTPILRHQLIPEFLQPLPLQPDNNELINVPIKLLRLHLPLSLRTKIHLSKIRRLPARQWSVPFPLHIKNL